MVTHSLIPASIAISRAEGRRAKFRRAVSEFERADEAISRRRSMARDRTVTKDTKVIAAPKHR
jgi:hypothetical protein